MRSVPPAYSGHSGAPDWPESVFDGLRELDAELSRLRSRREQYLREKAYELGLAAKDLADLRSRRGHSFSEQERYSSDGPLLAREDDDAARKALDDERAYWCGYEWLGKREDRGCGWVRGIPRSEPYDNIGVLSGSAGERHYCQICGLLIGEDRHIVS